MEGDESRITLVKKINSEDGKRIELSDLEMEEYDLRVKYEGERGEYLWRGLFSDQISEVLDAYGNGIERFVCLSGNRQLGGIS